MVLWTLAISISVLSAASMHNEGALAQVWPPWEPLKPPFYDANCLGRTEVACTGNECKWRTAQTPACWSKNFAKVDLPPATKAAFRANPVPLSKLLFAQHFGLHLSEGTINRHYYNTNVEECAARCLRAALGFTTDSEAALVNPTPLGNIKFPARRCLSFDFYPFENPLQFPPFNEAPDRGMCVLNTETKDTARARNEDMGYTDAELFYKSHFSKRPFSSLAGYYEVRDSRGGIIADMLDYEASSTVKGELGLTAEWGKSRWGVYHPNLPGYLPKPMNETLDCSKFNSDIVEDEPYLVDPDRAFRGGITPVGADQHCPGLVTKAEAQVLCASAGGRLCRDLAEVKLLEGRKLGCGFDDQNIWHALRPAENADLAYPRCCVTYETPLNCENYQAKQFVDCAARKRNDECLGETSGTQKKALLGFGKLLDIYRERCAFVNRERGLNCEQLLVQRWEQRQPDNGKGPCLWCPKPGSRPGGGEGECRPGNDYGICEGSSNSTKRTFGLKVRTYCIPYVNCHLASKFPHLQPYIFPVEDRVPVSPADPVDVCFPNNYLKEQCLNTPGCIWREEFRLCQRSDEVPPPIDCGLLRVKRTCKAAPSDCYWDRKSKTCKAGSAAERTDRKPCKRFKKRKPCNRRSPRCYWLRASNLCMSKKNIIIGNMTDIISVDNYKTCEIIPTKAPASQVAAACTMKNGCAWIPEDNFCLTKPCDVYVYEDQCLDRPDCRWQKTLGICMSLLAK